MEYNKEGKINIYTYQNDFQLRHEDHSSGKGLYSKTVAQKIGYADK